MEGTPRVTIPHILNITYKLHPKEAVEPSATRVSIFGAPENSERYPFVKNLPFIIMTAAASRSCTSPSPRWLCSKYPGSGQPHILWPMVIYMSRARNTAESMSRRLSLGVSVSRRSSSASSAALRRFSPAPSLRLAP